MQISHSAAAAIAEKNSMDMQPVNPQYYRMQFREFLLERARQGGRSPQRSDGALYADVYVTRDSGVQPPAPQGLGEYKHPAVGEKNPAAPEEPRQNVQEIAPKDDNWQAISAYRSSQGTESGPSVDKRQLMEELVRKRKKAGLSCPFLGKDNMCSAPFIRCGDRKQYSTRESAKQQTMPHYCRYRPGRRGGFVLIIDDDRAAREFCRNSLELFFRYEADKIITADSAYAAMDILNRWKIEGKHCGLAIIDSDLPGMSGFELVNELFERNHSVEIVLLEDARTPALKPKDYFGDIEIVPQKPWVSRTLNKPFHSQAFIDALRDIGLEPLES